jgi:hypothetical protein
MNADKTITAFPRVVMGVAAVTWQFHLAFHIFGVDLPQHVEVGCFDGRPT